MKANRGTVWINAGLLLIAAALFLSAYNERESHEARDSARQVIAQLCDALPTEAGDDEAEPTTLPESLPDVQREMPVKTINGRDYIGVLSIPSLELELPVISQWDYPALKVAPCRYSGSLYQDNLIICAHNYASHFGKLKELQPGDAVLFTDMDEHVVTFQVVERETLNPMDTEDGSRGLGSDAVYLHHRRTDPRDDSAGTGGSIPEPRTGRTRQIRKINAQSGKRRR